MRNSGYYKDINDYWIHRAELEIKKTYGHIVSVDRKAKSLVKFGRSEQVQQNTPTTLMTLPTGTYNETYVNGNLIINLSSSSSLDVGPISVEGHTITNSLLAFTTFTTTLNGQNKVTLTTSLRAMTRLAWRGSTDLVGDVYGYEDDTITNGVPDTSSKVHCEIRAGQNRSEKASTSISNSDYWIITGVYGDVLNKTSATAEIALETRQIGYAFNKIFDYSAGNQAPTFRTAPPYAIIQNNSDVRLRAQASGNGVVVSGGIFGVLAEIINEV